MMSNLDLEKWQKAIQSVEAGQKDLSLDELSAFRALKELAEKGNFESNENGDNIRILKDALPSHSAHRLLRAHLTNFIAVCEQYFTKKSVTVAQPQVSEPAAQSELKPQPQPVTPPLTFGDIPSGDIAEWQKAIQGIEAGQKYLSPEELSAFSALKELAGNGKFEANESNTFIKVIKDALPSHSNHRLLQKVHLPNFIKLCEKYFKVKVAALVDVLKTNVQGSALTFEPPVIQQPTIEPPIFEPPTVQPANQENADTTETQQEKQEQKIEPTKQKGSNTQLVLIIIAVALLIGGWQVYQNWNILFGKPEEISIDKTSLFFENISASEQLTATVLPDDIPRKNRKVSWHSNDTLVAIVNENGIVTAIASGNAVITAYTVNELSASCSVTVEIVTDSIEVELEQLADENELLIPLEAGKMQTEQTKNPTQQNQQISKEQQPTPSAKNNTDNTIASTIAEPLNQSNQSNQSQSQPVQPTQPAQPQYVENIHIIDGAYSGFVLNGKRQGNGVFMWDNGDKYEGNYENGVMSGYGKLHSPGRMFRYEGNFANGSFHGQGVYHNDRDGWRHEGAFFRGKPHGAGIRYYGKDMSRTLRGIWENGEFKTATR